MFGRGKPSRPFLISFMFSFWARNVLGRAKQMKVTPSVYFRRASSINARNSP